MCDDLLLAQPEKQISKNLNLAGLLGILGLFGVLGLLELFSTFCQAAAFSLAILAASFCVSTY